MSNWKSAPASERTLEFAQQLRRGLDYSAETTRNHRWTARAGSVAEADLASANAWATLAEASLVAALDAYLVGAAGHTEALIGVLEAGVVVHGPDALARAVYEHAALIYHLLEPELDVRDRVARVWLVREEAAEHDLRGRGIAAEEKEARLAEVHAQMEALFPGEIHLQNGRCSRIGTVRRERLTSMVDGFAKACGQALSPYAWASSRTHPNVTVLARSRTSVGGQTQLVESVGALELTVGLAAHALFVASTLIDRWYGEAPEAGDLWEEDIASVVPSIYKEHAP